METALAPSRPIIRTHDIAGMTQMKKDSSLSACHYWEKKLIWLAIKIRIFYFACILLRRPVRVWKPYQALIRLRKNVWGGDMKKMYKVGGRYYFNLYTPGWPSKAYDHIVKSELKRHAG